MRSQVSAASGVILSKPGENLLRRLSKAQPDMKSSREKEIFGIVINHLKNSIKEAKILVNLWYFERNDRKFRDYYGIFEMLTNSATRIMYGGWLTKQNIGRIMDDTNKMLFYLTHIGNWNEVMHCRNRLAA